MKKLLGLALIALFIFLYFRGNFQEGAVSTLKEKTVQTADNIISPSPKGEAARIENRVTKKPFGIFITRENSPISPERFYGYHTGTDFEAFESEVNIDVSVKTICEGKLLVKTTTSGYGGYAVQECKIDNQRVTVVYGHLKLSSITIEQGHALNSGDVIGVLGQGYSKETDNERKHLHLGIHIGPQTNIKGYVQSKGELVSWLDAEVLLKENKISYPF